MPAIHFRSNFKEKIISIAVAVLLWFVFVHESRLVYRSFEIPVKISSPASTLEIENITPEMVSITFLGPRREFYFFKANQVDLLLKITNPQPGTEYLDISESDLNFPEDLSLENIVPKSVSVQIDQKHIDKKTNSTK
jgi:hypothetical protein